MRSPRKILIVVFVLAVVVAPVTISRAGSRQLVVTTQSPVDGQVVSGSVTWQVSVSGGTPTRVDFAIDGTVRWSQTSSPYLYGGSSSGLDTTTLTNGSHVLTATAYGTKGVRSGTSRITVTVSNSVTAGPRVYWGAWIGKQLTGKEAPWDMTAVSKFEQMTGKPLSVLEFSSPFANCSISPCTSYPFPWTPFSDIRAHGAIPFFSWGSQSIPASPNEPNYQLADLIAGAHDSYIRSFATRAREWGNPFFLRFDWEMNGNWFPWGEGANGNQPGEFAAAWRHVHDIFTSVGAMNATWVWCPYVNPATSFASLYPGDAYVDWTCLDGYNWGTNPASPRTWRSFDYLFNSPYHQIVDTIAPSKPMIIGETASSEYGGSKAGWIHNMFEWLPTEFPKVRGLIWFEKEGNGMDWPLESSESSLSSFRTGIQDSRYVGNGYSGLSTNPIPAP